MSDAIRDSDFDTAWAVHKEYLHNGDASAVATVLARARERAQARAAVQPVDMAAAARAGVASAHPERAAQVRDAITRAKQAPPSSTVASPSQAQVSHMQFLSSLNVLSPRDWLATPDRLATPGGASPALQPRFRRMALSDDVAQSAPTSARDIAQRAGISHGGGRAAVGLVDALRTLPSPTGSASPQTPVHRTLARSLVRRSEGRARRLDRQQSPLSGGGSGSRRQRSPRRNVAAAVIRRERLKTEGRSPAAAGMKVRTTPLRKTAKALDQQVRLGRERAEARARAKSGRQPAGDGATSGAIVYVALLCLRVPCGWGSVTHAALRLTLCMCAWCVLPHRRGWRSASSKRVPVPEFIRNPPPAPHLPPPLVDTARPSGHGSPAQGSGWVVGPSGSLSPRSSGPPEPVTLATAAKQSRVVATPDKRRQWLKRSIVRSERRPAPPRKDGGMKFA